MSMRRLISQLRLEKKGGVRDLKFPGDCDQKSLLRAASRKGIVQHGGNHDTVIDPDDNQVVTQIPRHDPKSGTCRAIIKALKKALSDNEDRDDEDKKK